MSLVTSDLIVGGARIAYRDSGTGEPVIFLHGTPSHSGEWRHVLPQVEAAGHRTIAYDLLGYGRSERPVQRDTSVAAQADLLGELLDELGVSAACVVAHDIGGAVGMRFALAHPERVRKLVLIDSVSYDSWPSATWRKIIDEQLDDYRNLTQDAFNALLTRQLEMTVATEGAMAGDVLDAYLAPHQSVLGRTSFFEHQVRHYDSKYTEEISDRLDGLTI